MLSNEIEKCLGSGICIGNIVEQHAALNCLEFNSNAVSVDCSAIARIDAAGIQLLVAIRNSAIHAGGSVVFSHRSDALQQALDRAGVTL